MYELYISYIGARTHAASGSFACSSVSAACGPRASMSASSISRDTIRISDLSRKYVLCPGFSGLGSRQRADCFGDRGKLGNRRHLQAVGEADTRDVLAGEKARRGEQLVEQLFGR